MAIVWNWYGQDTVGTGQTEITGANAHELTWWGSEATPAFGTGIPLAEFNSNTHVMETTGSTDDCTIHIMNNRFVDADTMDLNEVDSAQISITHPAVEECCLRVRFYDDTTARTITDAVFFMYDQTTETNPPTNITCHGLEGGQDTAWTALTGGSATPVTLEDHGASSQEHLYYIAISVSPDAVGVLNNIRMKVTLTYQ